MSVISLRLAVSDWTADANVITRTESPIITIHTRVAHSVP
jgi:hypothetical protein